MQNIIILQTKGNRCEVYNILTKQQGWITI